MSRFPPHGDPRKGEFATEIITLVLISVLVGIATGVVVSSATAGALAGRLPRSDVQPQGRPDTPYVAPVQGESTPTGQVLRGASTPTAARAPLLREEDDRRRPIPRRGDRGGRPSAMAATSTPVLSRQSSQNEDRRTELEAGPDRGTDLADVVLLYDATEEQPFDTNFCRIATYYGLRCTRVALDATRTTLTDETLRDETGNYFQLIGISGRTLLRSPPALTTEELDILRGAVKGGANLLVSKFDDELNPAPLVDLTDGAVQGITAQEQPSRAWLITTALPALTREFTGQRIAAVSQGAQRDYVPVVDGQDQVTTVISIDDFTGEPAPTFVRWQRADGGAIFIDAGQAMQNLDETPLRELYYDANYFTSIVPLMLTMRYTLGSEAWHSPRDYANLTIDDPALTEPFHYLEYGALLEEMETHNFHTTIAMHPATWDQSEPGVVQLFLEYPNRYSLVQHGNNGDGYEFYKYTVSEDDLYNGERLPAKPLVDQEADIVEGLARMQMHRKLTGIQDDRIMIFPWGISPEPTLVLLKKYNYLGTVNFQDVPLDATRPDDWRYGMYQANMDYANFPALTRRHPGTYRPFEPYVQPFIFDLFIDKPALFYSHAYEGELFEPGIDTFNPVADQINGLTGDAPVAWRSLGDILRRLFLQKVNDDGSIDVKMYTNHLLVTTQYEEERVYHIAKEETLNVPIKRLTVNGHEFPYRIEEGVLRLDVRLPAQTTMEIQIEYGS